MLQPEGLDLDCIVLGISVSIPVPDLLFGFFGLTLGLACNPAFAEDHRTFDGSCCCRHHHAAHLDQELQL